MPPDVCDDDDAFDRHSLAAAVIDLALIPMARYSEASVHMLTAARIETKKKRSFIGHHRRRILIVEVYYLLHRFDSISLAELFAHRPGGEATMLLTFVLKNETVNKTLQSYFDE